MHKIFYENFDLTREANKATFDLVSKILFDTVDLKLVKLNMFAALKKARFPLAYLDKLVTNR